MNQGGGGASSQSTVLEAAWRRRGMVALSALAGAVLAFVVGELLPGSGLNAAVASVVVAESSEFAIGSAEAPERFVANQVQVLRSWRVARRTIEIVEDQGLGTLTRKELEAHLIIAGQEGSDQIVIRFTDADPERAVATANAVLEAYREVASAQIDQTADEAVERIESEISVLDDRLAQIESQLEQIESSNLIAQRLGEQAEDALIQIQELQAQFDATENQAVRETIAFALGELRSRVNLYLAAQTSAAASREVQSLLDLRSRTQARRSALIETRDQILVDSALNPGTIVFEDPADFTIEQSGLSGARAAVAGLILGLVTGAALATMADNRRLVVAYRGDVSPVLGAPLLATIPDFSEDAVTTDLPVVDSPNSESAEAFRYAVASLETALHDRQSPIVLITSPGSRHGKTVTVANLGLAAASAGHKVLLIDADFGSQHLSQMLLPAKREGAAGLTDVLARRASFDDAAVRVTEGGAGLYVMGRGSAVEFPSEVLQSEDAKDLMIAAKVRFDWVFIDGPPLLRVAYANSLLRLSDATAAVVPRGTGVEELELLKERIEFVNRPLVGYLFNRAELGDTRDRSSTSLLGAFPKVDGT